MWRIRTTLGRIRCARYFHDWQRTDIGWPYEDYYYCVRGWPLPCKATTCHEERAEYGAGYAMVFDLERVPVLRRLIRAYRRSRFAR